MTGASTGIGAALAMEAVKNGAKVAITARSLPQNGFSDFKKKYFRRGELLDKVKDQCIAKGGSASQVESLEIFVAPSIFTHFYVATLTFQILVLPLDLCNYAGHKAAFDKVVSSN